VKSADGPTRLAESRHGSVVPPPATGGGVGVGVACGSGWDGQVTGAGTGPEFQTVVPFVLMLTPPALTLTLIKHVSVNGTTKQFVAAPATAPEQLTPPPKALPVPGFQPPDT